MNPFLYPNDPLPDYEAVSLFVNGRWVELSPRMEADLEALEDDDPLYIEPWTDA